MIHCILQQCIAMHIAFGATKAVVEVFFLLGVTECSCSFARPTTSFGDENTSSRPKQPGMAFAAFDEAWN